MASTSSVSGSDHLDGLRRQQGSGGEVVKIGPVCPDRNAVFGLVA